MDNLTTVDDLIDRWRPLTTDEVDQAEVLIADVSSALRVYAHDRGMDVDEMIADYEPRETLFSAVVCDIVKREMCANNDEPAMSQMSQAAGGYSVSGTYLTPGGGLFIKNAELKMLGLAKQWVKQVGKYAND